VPVYTSVIIKFNLPMDTGSVESLLSISPEKAYSTTWTDDNMYLEISFVGLLQFETRYTISLGNAKSATGGRLENAPYIFSFITKDRASSSVSPEITITKPADGTEYYTGDIIEVSGTSKDLFTGVITITIGSVSDTDMVQPSGAWSILIKLPDSPGTYTLTVSEDGVSDSIIVKVTEEPTMPETEIREDDGANLLLIIISIMIIIIVAFLIFLLFLLDARRREEEAFDSRPQRVFREPTKIRKKKKLKKAARAEEDLEE
jgi:hypothetical protein